MKIENLKIADILIPEIILRKAKNEEKSPKQIQKWNDFVQSVKTYGVQTPIKVKPSVTDNTKYDLVDGRQRLTASQALGLETIPCIVDISLSDTTDTMDHQIVLNLQRFEQNKGEIVVAVKRWINGGKSLKEISAMICKPESYVIDLYGLNALVMVDSEVINDLNTGKISLASAFLIHKATKAKYGLNNDQVRELLSKSHVVNSETIAKEIEIMKTNNKLNSDTKNGNVPDFREPTPAFNRERCNELFEKYMQLEESAIIDGEVLGDCDLSIIGVFRTIYQVSPEDINSAKMAYEEKIRKAQDKKEKAENK